MLHLATPICGFILWPISSEVVVLGQAGIFQFDLVAERLPDTTKKTASRAVLVPEVSIGFHFIAWLRRVLSYLTVRNHKGGHSDSEPATTTPAVVPLHSHASLRGRTYSAVSQNAEF